ncbi:MAG: hypothetical protein JWO03_2049 [Bacteroidetes bacterium]|nr:hypothetical protein [Bacteroidota bacterium]
MVALPYWKVGLKTGKPKITSLDETSHIGLHIKKKRLTLVAKVIGGSEDCIANWENEKSGPSDTVCA